MLARDLKPLLQLSALATGSLVDTDCRSFPRRSGITNAFQVAELQHREGKPRDGWISPDEFPPHINRIFQLAIGSNVLTPDVPGVAPEKTNNRDLLRPAGKNEM